jgi:hypothetical protein
LKNGGVFYVGLESSNVYPGFQKVVHLDPRNGSLGAFMEKKVIFILVVAEYCRLGHTGKYLILAVLLLEQASFEQPIFRRIGVIHSAIGRADLNYDSVIWEERGIPQHIYIGLVRSLMRWSRPIIQTLRPSVSNR